MVEYRLRLDNIIDLKILVAKLFYSLIRFNNPLHYENSRRVLSQDFLANEWSMILDIHASLRECFLFYDPSV